MTQDDGLYIALFSIHGLIRGNDLELGRDADTGGQIKYVVELAAALGEHPAVSRVDLFTRLVDDPSVSADYAQPEEALGSGARIVRIPSGPAGYIRKEELWDSLDSFADAAYTYLREQPRLPNVIHSHYADAGYVGLRIAHRLGVPLVHTGHSLGRVKRRRLLASGLKRAELEARYAISRRIEAEEETLAAARLVIASTHNEVEDQYARYDYYQPERMAVIPPGTDLKRFYPSDGTERDAPIRQAIAKFLREPDRPMILALSRPDERKNISSLLRAYGRSPELQAMANLVIVAGNRDDLREMSSGAQDVLRDILELIDYYDLYGKIAYPKRHRADDVPIIYRIAADTRGVFVNPALTEPFGLTLIEAAASGLPIVATEDGGPQDIVRNCQNGLLVDPLDTDAIRIALLRVLADAERWSEYAQRGVSGAHEHYSWRAHAEAYLDRVEPILREQPPAPESRPPVLAPGSRDIDRALIVELDQALLGDEGALAQLNDLMGGHRKQAAFGIATGRGLESTLKVLKQHGLARPDVIVAGLGTEIYHGPQLVGDYAWAVHIDHQWNPAALRRILDELPGLELQPKSEQLRFKLSYYIDPAKAPDVEEINRLLRQGEQVVNAVLSYGQFLDLIPVRASKGSAVRHLADQWEIPLERILVAGGTRADEDMMRGNTLGVVVANPHREELSGLSAVEGVYFSEGPYARGILEAIDHYDFFGACRAAPGSPEAA
jgi:sucrose-phosphate synthase